MVNHATVSMTGYATRRSGGAGARWVWDIRSVNGKGLDLRLRLPEGIDGLEPALRAELQRAITRGNVTLSLRLERDDSAVTLRVSPAGLHAALAALRTVEQAAFDADLSLTPASMAEVLAIRGVIEALPEDADTGPLVAALVADLQPLLAEFTASRAAEGARLGQVIAAQIDRIEALTRSAAEAAEARRPEAAAALDAALARVMAGAAEAEPARIAQELALIAVKADVTEELDRLTAHVAAARGLIAAGGAVGRKLDFLMQEFMREANTLCSKAGNAALTAIGLDLKVVIDQMREQVQNLE